jgi:pimeloyl-ACP methyl ester carboxylesterase
MSAWVLRDGESINDIRPRHEVEAARLAASRSPAATVPMDVDKWASRFMQDATPAQFAEATARLVPTPIGWLDEPVTLPRFFDLELPAGYVFLRDDLSAPRELFQQMADRLHDPRIVEADGGHQAMLTRPDAVAAALLTAAADDTTDS